MSSFWGVQVDMSSLCKAMITLSATTVHIRTCTEGLVACSPATRALAWGCPVQTEQNQRQEAQAILTMQGWVL